MNANAKTLSERVIGCAFAVSNALGAGFLEQVYEKAMAIELAADGLEFERQKGLNVFYRDCNVGHYIADFVVSGKLVVEIKALAGLTTQHEAQLLNYLRAGELTVGLLLNFGTPRLGVKRMARNHNDELPV